MTQLTYLEISVPNQIDGDASGQAGDTNTHYGVISPSIPNGGIISGVGGGAQGERLMDILVHPEWWTAHAWMFPSEPPWTTTGFGSHSFNTMINWHSPVGDGTGGSGPGTGAGVGTWNDGVSSVRFDCAGAPTSAGIPFTCQLMNTPPNAGSSLASTNPARYLVGHIPVGRWVRILIRIIYGVAANCDHQFFNPSPYIPGDTWAQFMTATGRAHPLVQVWLDSDVDLAPNSPTWEISDADATTMRMGNPATVGLTPNQWYFERYKWYIDGGLYADSTNGLGGHSIDTTTGQTTRWFNRVAQFGETMSACFAEGTPTFVREHASVYSGVGTNFGNNRGNRTVISDPFPNGLFSGGPPPSTFGDNNVESLTDTNAANFIIVNTATLSVAPLTISKLTAYLQGGTNPQSLRAVLYSDNAGTPNSLLAISSEKTIAANQAVGWVDFPISPLTLNTNGTYWMGWWFGATSDGATEFRQTSSGSVKFASATYSSSSNPAGGLSWSAPATATYSLYAPIVPQVFSQNISITTSANVSLKKTVIKPPKIILSTLTTLTKKLIRTFFVSTVSGLNGFQPALPNPAPNHTRIGHNSFSNLSNTSPNRQRVNGPYGPLPVGSLIDQFYLYTGDPQNTTAQIRMLVYQDNGGTPGALVGVTQEAQINVGVPDNWLGVVPSSPIAASGLIHIGWWQGGDVIDNGMDTVSNIESLIVNNYSTLGSPTNPFGSPTIASAQFALVADYTSTESNVIVSVVPLKVKLLTIPLAQANIVFLSRMTGKILNVIQSTFSPVTKSVLKLMPLATQSNVVRLLKTPGKVLLATFGSTVRLARNVGKIEIPPVGSPITIPRFISATRLVNQPTSPIPLFSMLHTALVAVVGNTARLTKQANKILKATQANIVTLSIPFTTTAVTLTAIVTTSVTQGPKLISKFIVVPVVNLFPYTKFVSKTIQFAQNGAVSLITGVGNHFKLLAATVTTNVSYSHFVSKFIQFAENPAYAVNKRITRAETFLLQVDTSAFVIFTTLKNFNITTVVSDTLDAANQVLKLFAIASSTITTLPNRFIFKELDITTPIVFNVPKFVSKFIVFVQTVLPIFIVNPLQHFFKEFDITSPTIVKLAKLFPRVIITPPVIITVHLAPFRSTLAAKMMGFKMRASSFRPRPIRIRDILR